MAFNAGVNAVANTGSIGATVAGTAPGTTDPTINPATGLPWGSYIPQSYGPPKLLGKTGASAPVTNPPFNINPAPQQGSGTFGAVPGPIGMPNPYGDLSGVY